MTTIGAFDDNGGDNDGVNKLVIGSGGTFEGSTDVYGLLQLASGGEMTAVWTRSQVLSGGRFEAAGSGLNWKHGGLSVSDPGLVVKNGGTLAVGLTGDAGASVLQLNTITSLEEGSTFEMSIFGALSSDRIELTDQAFVVSTNVNLKLVLEGYSPSAGDGWSLLFGNTASYLTGTNAANMSLVTLDAPALGGGLSWDMSKFDEANGWRVEVVPEPSSMALLGAAFLGLATYVARRKNRV